MALVGAPAQVKVGETVAISAQVQGATNTAVTWTVDGIQNGNSTVGTIAGSGNAVTYTAPTAVGSHVLAAISVLDPSKSADAHVNVLQSTNTALVILSPTAATISSGATTAYYAAVSGSESQDVTWFVDGIANGNPTVGALAPNGDGAHVLYMAPAAGGTHTVKAVATNASGASVSGSTTVTVQGTSSAPVAPSITTQPRSVAVTAGQAATFTVVATGTASLSYQWRKGGTAISGATAASYTTPATVTGDSGTAYSVVVTNGTGSVTSNPATLTVTSVTVPSGSTSWPGFGHQTTGGAGQTTVHVTNLNDSGAGSFRAAVGSNRTIVFDVGGTISLTSADITFSGVSNVTIDGSATPSPGVTFDQRGINFVSSNNIIVTNIRHRGGYNAGAESGGCLTFHPNCFNVVVDRCSFSGFQDEAIDLWNGNHDVTIQNCIVGAGMSGTGHNYECLIGDKPYNITLYHNLFHRGQYRNPAIGYADPDSANYGSVSPVLCAEIINNVTYGYTAYGITIYWGATANVIGNWLWTDASGMNTPSRALDCNNGTLAQAYASGNYLKGGSTPTGNVSSPFSVASAAQITASSAADAANYVKANAGCRVGGLDAVDQTILNDLVY